MDGREGRRVMNYYITTMIIFIPNKHLLYSGRPVLQYVGIYST